jgi:stage V sporulation protein B
MEKELDMGRRLATGSFQLLIGVGGSTVIMAIGTIILGRLLTVDEFGLYAIALIPVTTMSLFRDWGMNSAMIRYIASSRVSDQREEMRDFIVAGLIFEVAAGLALSLLSIFLAGFIGSTVFHRPESGFYIAIVSVSIIAGALLAASQAVFIGFERMGLNSFTLICQAIAKVAVGPLLVFLGYSVLGAVIGYTLSFIAAAMIGLFSFYFLLFRPLRKGPERRSNIGKKLRIMLNYGVPLSISYILGSILSQIYALVMPSFASNAMIGNYQTALNFSVLLTFFTIPIGTVLFPAFAKLNPHDDSELLKTIYASSIKYTSILLVPATMAIMALSGPMIGTLYGEKYVYGPFFLTINVLGTLFVALGTLSATGLLSGLGQTRMLMKQSMLTVGIGIPLGFFLIPPFGIPGIIVASLFAGMPSTVWVLYWIWKHYKARPEFQSSARILLASAFAAFAAYLPTVFLNTSNWIKLVVGLIVFLIVYVLGAPGVGAISKTDITSLKIMFSGLGVLSRIMNAILKLAEKTARSTQGQMHDEPELHES